MQAPGAPDEDRSGGFVHGGWLVPYADEDIGRLVVAGIAAADAFLLGRRTYEIFAAHWPRVTDPNDPVATALNSRPKYVASRTLTQLDWKGSSVLQGDLAQEVARLKRQPGNELQVHGSGGLAQALIQNDLVDEYRLWVFPVVLGSGKRLFGSGTVPAAMKLVETSRTSTGTVFSRYERAGKPSYGSFALEKK